MRLRRIIEDLGRSFHGITTIMTNLLSRQELDVAIGLLTAESKVATKGQKNLYVVRLANRRCAPRLIHLTIDVCAADVLERSKGCAAHFSQSFTVQPCTAMTIAFQYNWTGEAYFHCNGATFPPESYREGVVLMPQRYAVTAILSEAGRRLDKLTVYQILAA